MKELKYLNKYLLKYKFQIFLGIIISIIARIFSLFAPRLVNNSLSIVEEYIKYENISTETLQKELLINIGLIIITALISGFFTFLIRQTIINVSRYIEYDLKNEIFLHYQNLSIEFYKKNRTGDLMTRITEDVSKVRMYFGPAIMYSINTTVLFIIVIASMINLAPTLSLYTLIPLPVLSIIIFKLSKSIHIRTTIIQQTISRLSSFTQETFSGISIIKSFNIEPRIESKFNLLSIESKDRNLDLAKIQAWFFPLMILMIGLSNSLVIYVGGIQYIEEKIDIGVLAEFILYVSMLTWPVATVGWVTSIVQQAEASQKRINAFLKQKPKILEGFNEKNIKGEIRFNNVKFKYSGAEFNALNNISFKILPGEKIGIIGNTGSGKSTILDLILRLYDVTNGEILIDNINIKDYSLKTLRNSIGYVPQNPFLFSETIIENIKYGNYKSKQLDVEKFAKKAQVHKEIIKFNSSYKTLLGERGVTLSGGQRQRISIARALIKKPQILIFDDCLSSVDSETEDKILKEINNLGRSRTLIITSNNISSIIDADKILVIQNGEIIQMGSHKKLIEINGYYRSLYNKQKTEKQ
ncbi:MAG: ABC transporter ATP-binding protein [Flavobacteriaceae bacterium]|nr:ABC transporter ATP-binding protein [Flavobacteriaceae bacterium]